MKFVIFPGGSDPYHLKYKSVYDLIKDEAKNRGFGKVILPSYPGHQSYAPQGELTLKGACQVVEKTIETLENEKIGYYVLCRSFGCFPFLEVIKQKKTKFLKKAVLWGAPPYHLYYQVAYVDFEKNYLKAVERGTTPSKNLFFEVYPIELSLQELEIEFKLYVTSGDQDPFHPKPFNMYLDKSNKNSMVEFPEMVKGEAHEVRMPNKDYLDILFNPTE